MVGMVSRRVYAPTYIRAWRKERGLTLERLRERMGQLSDVWITKTSLSRIERGEQPYSQPILEAIAEALETEPASLLMRDPGQPEMIWSIWDRIEPAKRTDALRVLEALATKCELPGNRKRTQRS